MAWFKNGTINVTNGSDIVTGNNAGFNASIKRGDMLVIDGVSSEIDGVVNGSQLKLAGVYTGPTATNIAYGIVRTNALVADLTEQTTNLLDIAADILENGGGGTGEGGTGQDGEDGKSAYELAVEHGFVGTETQWLASLKGPKGDPGEDGQDGSDGEGGSGGQGAIVNLNEYTGQVAGGSGISIIVPVAEGDPPMTLTQTAQVILPADKPDAGIAIWAKSTTSGIAIVLGLTNAPEPQPGGSDEELDLSGSGTVYGAPGSIFPLGIYLANSTADFDLTVPSGFPLKVERRNDIIVPVASQWMTDGAGSPYPVTGDAVGSSAVLNKVMAEGATTDFRNGHVVLNKDTYLTTDALSLAFKQTTDEISTQTPNNIKVSFKGIVPDGTTAILASLYDYAVGEFSLGPHWSGNTMKVTVGRGSGGEDIISDEGPERVLGTLQTYEVEYIDNVGGDGGTIRFYIDGVQFGADKPCATKPRISPAMRLSVNAQAGNTANSIDNLEIEYVGVSFGKPDIESTYEVVTSGPIPRADLEALVVDATSFSTDQEPVVVSYTADGTQTYDLTVVVGEMEVPAGRAYKVVLEDWSTGSGVPQPNELVMTRPAAQNCRFEDTTLYGSQASWTEVLPQGPVPTIGNISYYCEGIRMGNYVQLQFGYDWSPDYMPSVPFGNPEGKDTYMVPHKWMIYDVEGTLLGRIEQPSGQPLNSTASPTCWSGTTDGRGVPVITAANKWYPKGTVRSGIIWRSHEPAAYDQEFIWDHVPTYDIAVPFASQTGYSVNGGDLRLIGGDGQMNGFGNYRWMPWEGAVTYDQMIASGENSLNPWKVGTNADAQTPNANLWLKYTPFNQTGRSPTTGPGGTRDDRQIMPEPVARYARDVTVKRPHDNRDMKQIALDYLTAYVSDPFQCIEKGRLTPLFKSDARRNITLRNHYYGPGEATTPPEQAFYVQGGRVSEFVTGSNPLKVSVPYAGKTSSEPYFGTNQIDELHGHQYPHWGSLLWQTPEFAMLGTKFFDQVRLYNNVIMNTSWAGEFAERGAAWKFAHAALAWKTASSNSSRLYSRAEVLDWIVFDFESFYDLHYASDPGFLNPPSTTAGGDDNLRIYCAAQYFGPCLSDADGIYQHDFMIGYWLSALHMAEKIGFNDALREASDKCEAVINWLITMNQKRITNKMDNGMLVNAGHGAEYVTPLWTETQMASVSGDYSQLPHTYEGLAEAQGANKAPSWDSWSDGTDVYSRDGQAMDQLLAGPSLLLDMGRTAPELVAAEVTALAYRQEKIDSETARGPEGAGDVWFKFHQTTNNPPYKPS